MATSVSFLLHLFALIFIVSEAKIIPLQPESAKLFNISYIQNVRSCYYTVYITTSCYSNLYTRDQISLSFGDAYGNQIYTPRLDDPSSGTFERCSSDTFQVKGPCAYQICYVYFYRTGPDGWEPESVTVAGSNSRDVTFYYNAFIPSDVWYGFNLCKNRASSLQEFGHRWIMYVILGLILSTLL